jgi:hypothetical protein
VALRRRESEGAQLGKTIAGGSTGAKKGRAIRAYGWHRFRPNVAVAELLLHVEGGNKPLLITRYTSSTGLIAAETYAVRSLLLACALDIADVLQSAVGIDHG